MEFRIRGLFPGRTEPYSAETATEAAAIADRLRADGANIVHIELDGRRLEDADEFEQMIEDGAKSNQT